MPKENIRNFVIIAHIDHGKSTLADRFLEITQTVPSGRLQPQFLDQMNLEREHGVTIKMHPVRMCYSALNNQKYILNLIDTPGHADFNYEVSRALAAVEGAVLLVDGTQGIQAQTLSNLELAQKQGLTIIGAVNKIDLLDIEERKMRQKELAQLLQVSPEEISLISAKTGEGVRDLLERIVSQIPAPKNSNTSSLLRALIFDSHYDYYQGVIAYIRIFQGEIKIGDSLTFLATKATAEISSLGYFTPDLRKSPVLKSGEIGWLATGLKQPALVRIGDTLTNVNHKQISLVEPLPGYKEPRPMVYASFYLRQGEKEFETFKRALMKLKLNDWALQFTPESSEVLGRGFRLGFLGLFHLEIVQERLQREYGLEFVITNPTVPYRIWIKGRSEPLLIATPAQWPEEEIIKSEEPWVEATIITPSNYLSKVIQLIHFSRGTEIQTEVFNQKIRIKCQLPLEETIKYFYDKLKSVSQGFASFDYRFKGYKTVELEKLEVWLAKKPFESLSKIVIKEKIENEAHSLALKLKKILPRQNYPLAIQIKVRGKVIARETIPALRKDVTGHLYGGDRTRKVKLWQKQKAGKKKLLEHANLHLPPSVFIKLFTQK